MIVDKNRCFATGKIHGYSEREKERKKEIEIEKAK